MVLVAVVALALPLLGAGAAHAGSKEAAIVSEAIEVLEQAGAIPGRCIPLGLLREAQGVAIIPGIIKAGFVIGGRHGRGVLLVRCQDGGWSNPIFVTLSGGSIGWQAGAQSTDLVLVFKTRRSVERILENRGKLTLGADLSIAAGPLGRETSAATDAQLKAEIFSYSRSRGLFAGASFDGDALLIDRGGNGAFYGRRGASPYEIVTGTGILIPEVALKLRAVLMTQTAPPPPFLPPTPAPAPAPIVVEPRHP
jgi:lipid-binding SYLF domain-containing protein